MTKRRTVKKKVTHQEQMHAKDGGRLVVTRFVKDSSFVLICEKCLDSFTLNTGWPVGFSKDFVSNTPIKKTHLPKRV